MDVNLNNNIEIATLSAGVLAHADVKSNYLDTAGYGGVILGVAVGTLTGVDGSNYLLPVVQSSDTTTDTDFEADTDVVSSPAFSKIDSSDEDLVVQKSVYIGSKRYVRVLLDVTSAGSYPTGDYMIFAVCDKAMRNPPSAPTTGAAV